MAIEILPGYKTECEEIVTVFLKKTINSSVYLLSTDYVLSHLIGVQRKYRRRDLEFGVQY